MAKVRMNKLMRLLREQKDLYIDTLRLLEQAKNIIVRQHAEIQLLRGELLRDVPPSRIVS